MQSSTDKNIQINPLIQRNINQQQLIFGHSKYLFYDSNQMNNVPKSRQGYRSNTGAANMKKIQSKINYSVSRPQTTHSKARDNMRPRNFKKKSNVTKQNDNFVININFKIQNNQKEEQKSMEISQLKNPVKNTTERSKNQVSSSRSINSSILNKKKPQAFVKSPNKDKIKTKVKSKTSVTVMKQKTIKQKSIKQIKIHQEQKQLQPNSGREVQSINESRIKLNHDRIKQFFGTHHQFFKINEDYLHFDGKQDDFRAQLSIYPLQAQKKLQQQIKNLTSPKNTIYNNNQKSENNSLIYGVNSKFFTNSFFVQPGIERASILQYIKNSSTKKLFSILVGQNNQNQNKEINRYIDPQFNHEKINKINDCNVEWMYIKPGFETRIFPDSNCPSQSIKRKIYVQSSKKQMLFVKFIRFLYFYEPEFISRLFEPAINNVYSVWFFMNGCYEPIFIDGYFPLDEKLNHLYGSSGEFLWLPILIKCICKMKDTYCQQILSKITFNQIYKLLTGMELQHLQRKLQEQTDQKLYKRILKFISRGSTPLIFSSKTKSFQIINLDLKSPTDLISFNPITEQSNPITKNMDRSQQIIILPPFLNWFIYFLQINKNSLNKFEIFCQRNIEFILSTGLIDQKKQRKQKRIYIYECEQSENRKKSIKTKLILKYQATFIDSFSSKLKRGSYKIFIEQGQKKIHLLLSDKKTVTWQSNEVESIPITISLFTTQQVKISEIEQLQRRGQFLEDSENIYHKKNKIDFE